MICDYYLVIPWDKCSARGVLEIDEPVSPSQIEQFQV